MKRRSRRSSTRERTRPPEHAPARPIFEALALRLNNADPDAAGRDVRILAESLGPGWRPRAVAPALGEYQLVRDAGRRIATGAAWSLAYRLRESTAVAEAEPLFTYCGLQPDPDQLDRFLAPHELPRSHRRSSGDDAHKPCAAGDPQWSVKAVNAPAAWELCAGKDSSIVIGHPDTGYSQHPEIWGPAPQPIQPTLGHDFLDDKADPVDPLDGKYPGHGTATASVIMSPPGGMAPAHVVGTAPNARLVPLRVSDSVIHMSFARLCMAIYHAVDNAGAHVISMSLGGPMGSRALERALQYAVEKGVIPLAAAGNVWPWVVYPARYDMVVAVAASNCQLGKWRKSASGDAVDVSAPGESVWRAEATLVDGQPRFRVAMSSGTSYAVATTAGVCALWLAHHGRDALKARYGLPALAGVFRKVLTAQGVQTPPGWETKNMGAGIVDALRTVTAPLPAAAAGVRARAARGPLAEVLDYFPSLDPDRVLSAIAARMPPSRGRRQAVLKVLGDELLFHLATDPRLRAYIHQRASGAIRTARTEPPAIDASPAFRRGFGL